MNIQKPVSSLMTTNVMTVSPTDKLQKAQDIFNHHRIHHIPVTNNEEVVGMLSMTDLLYFLKGKSTDSYDEILNEVRLKNYTVAEIMTTGLATLEPDDLIRTALNIFKENLFHALPIVKEGKLVGLLSAQDIIVALANEETLN
jgi:acetoin utilization protein AcuB